MSPGSQKTILSGPFNAEKVILLLLAVATVFGLFCGLIYAVNLELISDMIVPGIVAKEIVNYHNFQYFFPANDPYLFTDIYTFYLITQAISGYNPLALKLTAYLMFLILVGIFSYILYRCSGVTNALIFSALFANMSPAACTVFITPENHVGTLIATGLMIILFSVGRLKNAGNAYIFIVCLAAGLVVLSDSIFMAFFIVPWIVYFVYFYGIRPSDTGNAPEKKRGKGIKETVRANASSRKERSSLNKAVILLIIFTALSFFVISYFGETVDIDVPNFIPTPTTVVNLSTMMSVNFPALVQSLALLLNSHLYSLLTGSLNIFGMLVSLVFIAIVSYSLMKPGANAKYVYTIFLVSSLLMICGFLFTDWVKDSLSPRYLIFVALALFAAIGLAYRAEVKIGYNLNTLFLALVLVLLLSTIPTSIAAISHEDYQPNKEDYAFITYLKDNHFTYGFSDYWTAHKLSYLSGDELNIRPVGVKDKQMKPISWLTTKRWYYTRYTNFILIAGVNDPMYDEMLKILPVYPANDTYYYKDYVILQYRTNDTAPIKWFYQK